MRCRGDLRRRPAQELGFVGKATSDSLAPSVGIWVGSMPEKSSILLSLRMIVEEDLQAVAPLKHQGVAPCFRVT